MHSALDQALLACVIPAPLRMQPAAPAPVQCTLGLSAGAVEVSSSAPGGRQLAHLRASASRIAPARQAPATLDHSLRMQPIAVAMAAATAAAAQRAARLPAATAGIALHAAQPASGFLAHPAVTDSMLHIGAALAASAQSGETRVPTAVGAFSPRKELAATQQDAWASAAVSTQLPDGSAASSYRLSAADSATEGVLVELAELQAKAANLASMAAASAGQARKEDVQPRMLYHVTWQAGMPAKSPVNDLPWLRSRERHVWQQAAAGQHIRSSRHLLAHASASCLADVAVLQHMLAQSKAGAAAGLALITTGAQQQQDSICRAGRPIADSNAAAAWGLVRVAAGERPDLAWAATDVQPMQAAHAAGAVPQSDAFGAVSASGAMLLPRILAEHGRDSSEEPLASAAGGRAVISGGLGGESSLVARTCQDCDLSTYAVKQIVV